MPHIAVLGAAGRVGRAVTSALLRAGHDVTGVVRDPGRSDLGVPTVRGDARRLGELEPLLGTVDGVVLAVTPFSAPPESFDGFDLDYYAHIVAEIDGAWHRPRRRLVAVGLTATLMLDSGVRVMDDPSLFPSRLRPFAEAHLRAGPALVASSLEWAVLAPPAGFGEGEDERGYRLVAEPVGLGQAVASLSHAAYARAVVAELVKPTVHNRRVAVVPEV